MKVKIEPLPKDGTAPYSNLLPITELLVFRGNAYKVASGFFMTRDGWRCELVKPIDFTLVREAFDLPPSIELCVGEDTIVCWDTWVGIHGGCGTTDDNVRSQFHIVR